MAIMLFNTMFLKVALAASLLLPSISSMVNVSKAYVSTSDATVNYSYSKAKASLHIDVHDGDGEMGQPTKNPKSVTTWNGGSKSSSRNWNAVHHYTS